MDDKPFTLTEDQLAELNKRVSAAKKEDRQTEAAKYFAELQGATVPDKKSTAEVYVNVTDEQLDRILNRNVNEKEIAKEVTETLKETTGVPHSEAKAVATNELSERISKLDRKRKENKLVANTFSALFRLKKGYGNFQAVEDAYKAEAEYLGRDTHFTAQNKEERAMSVGTDTAGGFFAPEIFSTVLYERLERYGMARKHARMIPMESEILRFPKLTTDVTASVVAEAGTIAASDIVSDQLTLQPQKLAVMAGPFSDELLLHADPGIVEILNDSAARALAKLEDNNVFIGDAGSFTGLLENATSNTTNLSGALSTITFEDIIDLQDSLEERYRTEGVGFWWNKSVTRELRKQKGADQFFWGDMASSRLRTLLGDPYFHIVDMVAAPSGADTDFGVYMDLDLVWVGTRGGLRIDMLTEGPVGGVNLGETASMALRVIEYWDNEVIDDDGVALIRTT